MKKIVITGGAGFIGSHFVDYICKTHPDYRVIVIDSLTYAGDVNNIESDIEFCCNNICDLGIVHYLHNADIVVNFAAETHVDNSIKSSAEFMHTNILGVHNLLDIVREYKIPKFIQMSTDEVYGSADLVGSFTEEAKLNPGNPYSASKCAADLLIKSYINTYKIPAIIVRPTNNFGPRQYPEKLIPFFVKRLVEGKTIPVYGDGMNVRDWLYVGDTCKAIDMIMHDGQIGEIYNIAGESELPNVVVIKKILEIMGLGENRIEYVADRLGHDRRYSISSLKLKCWMGEYISGNFNENLKNTVLWFKEKFKEEK